MSKIQSLIFLLVTSLAVSATARANGTIHGTVEAKPAKFLKDTIVYVKQVPNAKLTPKTAQIDQKGMEFAPHILLIAAGDTVKFTNHDNVTHNVMSPDANYDLGSWGQGQSKEHTFKVPGVFAQVCKLHPEMLAYVFVGQNRLAAVVDGQGNFTIGDVPAGTYELDVWNPKLKAAPQKVTVSASGTATAHFAIHR